MNANVKPDQFRKTIEDVEYSCLFMGDNIHGEGAVYMLSPIGKRGKPLARHRPGVLRPDGSWRLHDWARRPY